MLAVVGQHHGQAGGAAVAGGGLLDERHALAAAGEGELVERREAVVEPPLRSGGLGRLAVLLGVVVVAVSGVSGTGALPCLEKGLQGRDQRHQHALRAGAHLGVGQHAVMIAAQLPLRLEGRAS